MHAPAAAHWGKGKVVSGPLLLKLNKVSILSIMFTPQKEIPVHDTQNVIGA